MNKNLFRILFFLSFVLMFAFMFIGLSGSFITTRGFTCGDTLYGYRYTGETLTTEACNFVNIIADKLGTDILINSITIKNICDKQIVGLDVVSTVDANLGLPWVTKTPLYRWSLPMSILLWIGFIGSLVAIIIFIRKS